MKVLHIIPYISSNFGGPPFVAKSLNNLFNEHGFDSKILTLGSKNESTGYIFYFKKNTKFFFFSFDFLINTIKYFKDTDVIFIHGLYTFPSLWSSFIGYFLKKKMYLLPHGMLDRDSVSSGNFLKNSLRRFFIYTVVYFQVKVANQIIFNSAKEQKNSFMNYKSIIIHNGVDIESIQKIKCDKEYFNKDKVNLFFLGRIHPIKGIELIIDAINMLDVATKQKIHLTIAGAGSDDYIGFLKKRIQFDNIDFIGHIDGNKKHCYLRQCDIYLQPSYTEGLSISLLESMANRALIMTTNKVGIYEELMQYSAGYVIDCNHNAIKDGILEILNGDYGLLRKNAYDLVCNKYNWNNIFKEYKTLVLD